MVEKEDTVPVKWLYPGAEEDQPSVSDMDSELQTDKSVNGSEASSPSTSGPEGTISSCATPDSATAAPTIAELGQRMTAASTAATEYVGNASTAASEYVGNASTAASEYVGNASTAASEYVGNASTAASSYVGSLFSASSWYSGSSKQSSAADKGAEAEGDKPADSAAAEDDGDKPKNAATATSGISGLSSAFFSSFGKVGGQSKDSKTDQSDKETEEGQAGQQEGDKEEKKSASTGFGYFSSALSAGISGISSSISSDFLGDKSPEEEKKDKEVGKEGEKQDAKGEDFFSSAFSKVGQAASTYTKVIQETVSKAPIIAEFNQEQTNFIKSKGGQEVPVAPWSGYIKEEELKEKIINLSLDQRNFLRAPPSGVEFDMENAAVATHAVVLLKEDPRLEKIRYELVPKQIKEADFWRNYFYRVGVLQQSYELDMATLKKETKKNESESKVGGEEEGEASGQVTASAQDQDDEFVSDSHQVSSKDLAEADEAMRKLGLDNKNEAEWEAELEGELEYEMVQGEADMDNPEWEEQIQELLDAESKESK